MKKFIYLAVAALLLTGSSLTSEQKQALSISGSTREDSYNKKLAQIAANIAKEQDYKVTVIDLKDYPAQLFDEDFEKESGMPESMKKLRKQMIESDLIIIATPEYNASISGVLKNALDWASRDEQGNPSADAYKGKKFAIMSASLGQGGGARALKHLRAILSSPGGDVAEIEVAVPSAYNAFDNEGNLKDKQLQEKLRKEIEQASKK